MTSAHMIASLKHADGRDALERILAAANQGWTCLLRMHHVFAIDGQIGVWRRECGLPDAAAIRIRSAARRSHGVRLSAGECRQIRRFSVRRIAS